MDDNKSTGKIVHCFNKGVLGIDLFNNNSDRWRFLRILRYKNHEGSIRRWHQHVDSLVDGAAMPWPSEWPEQNRLVHIAGYTLMDNHYHLILQEVAEDGISRFMKKLSNSYIAYLRTKYNRDKRLFRGSYKSKVVTGDNQLRKLFVYILIKNNFELYPGGSQNAIDEFYSAFDHSCWYDYSALKGLTGGRRDDTVTDTLFFEYFQDIESFKKFAEEQMNNYRTFLDEIDGIIIE